MELCDIQIYDLYAASRRTVVVCAAIHAGFFEFLLKRGAAQAADLEVEFGWTRKGSDAMLVSLFAMDLLIKVDPGTGEWGEETYSPSQLTCNFLDRSKPFYIGDLFELEYKYFTNPSGLLEILKKPLNPENFFGMCQTTEDAAFFTKAMHSISSLPAFHAAQKFEWGTYKCVLDVGGGSGIYSISIVKQNPHMKAIVYDIEKVLPATKGYIASYNVEDQVMTASGDMFENEGKDYPRYFEKGDVKVAVDVIFHSQILHDWSVDLGVLLLFEIISTSRNENPSKRLQYPESRWNRFD